MHPPAPPPPGIVVDFWQGAPPLFPPSSSRVPTFPPSLTAPPPTPAGRGGPDGDGPYVHRVRGVRDHRPDGRGDPESREGHPEGELPHPRHRHSDLRRRRVRHDRRPRDWAPGGSEPDVPRGRRAAGGPECP